MYNVTVAWGRRRRPACAAPELISRGDGSREESGAAFVLEAMMEHLSVVLTEQDALRLRSLIATQRATGRGNRLERLANKVEGALVVSVGDVSADVVTLYSEVRIANLQTGQCADYTLVMPQETDLASNRLSVLAPLGSAAIGCREGDEVQWPMPGGLQRLRIEKILHQPEATRRSGRRAPRGDWMSARARPAAIGAAGGYPGLCEGQRPEG